MLLYTIHLEPCTIIGLGATTVETPFIYTDSGENKVIKISINNGKL